MTISLAAFVFAVMLAAMLLSATLVIILNSVGLISFEGLFQRELGAPIGAILWLSLVSLVVGTAITMVFSRFTLKPLRRVIAATRKVAGGDFGVRLQIRGVWEMRELASSFNKMAQDLSSIETLRSDFVNNFSHEFKTPIVSVRGFAKLLKDEKLSEEERREYIDIIIAETERLAQLSTNVLMLSKFENIEIIPDIAPFRLDEQIRRTAVLTEPRWSAKELELNLELEELSFNGNEDLTQQLWLNLLDNAIKFSYRGGKIQIALKKEDGGVRFTIRDEGEGMDAAVMRHIFDKFYQGDSSHSKYGNGLGLAIVNRIIKLCGGGIEIESRPGKGSRFSVFLPETE
jgi:signal transduction histidine kinase